MNFPKYLKLGTTNTWYKITDDHSFMEVKTLGGFYSISEFSDDILPMRNHISDLIEHDGTQEVSELEFQNYLEALSLEKKLKAF